LIRHTPRGYTGIGKPAGLISRRAAGRDQTHTLPCANGAAGPPHLEEASVTDPTQSYITVARDYLKTAGAIAASYQTAAADKRPELRARLKETDRTFGAALDALRDPFPRVWFPRWYESHGHFICHRLGYAIIDFLDKIETAEHREEEVACLLARLKLKEEVTSGGPTKTPKGRNLSDRHPRVWWAHNVLDCGENGVASFLDEQGVYWEGKPRSKGIRVDLDGLTQDQLERYRRRKTKPVAKPT
jgi:hypothetical protein